MEKLAVSVLRFLNNQSAYVSFDDLKDKFGPNIGSVLSYLEKNEYVHQGQIFRPHQTAIGKEYYMKNGTYQITSKGRAFLEEKPGKDFDKWLNRFNILLPIIGGALLSKPLWDFLEWLWNWMIGLF